MGHIRREVIGMIAKGREGDKTMGKKEMRTVQERKGEKKTGKDREWKVMIEERGEEDREGEKTNKGKEMRGKMRGKGRKGKGKKKKERREEDGK